MPSILRNITGTQIIMTVFWTVFWFCFFFGPLWYLLPMVDVNPWWSFFIGAAGAGVFALKAAALIWLENQEQTT